MSVNSLCSFFALLLITCTGCSRTSSQSSGPVAEPRPHATSTTEKDSLSFDISPVSGRPQQWLATSISNGKTAKFRIELAPAIDSGQKEFPMSFGKGKFLREPGSEPEYFLADLAKVLQAAKLPQKVQKTDSLDFEYVVLGRNQSHSPDGSFGNSKNGDWTATKIFLGDDQGEVFFNFSPMQKKAEFSIKDSDYGDFVVAEFAKVL
jgi:hypothetical protein